MKLKDLFESGASNITVAKDQTILECRQSLPARLFPDDFKGSFDCSHNKVITDLEGCPRIVRGTTFNAHMCKKLVSLKGAPEEVAAVFNAWGCDLTTYEGAPKRIGTILNIEGNPRLTNLKGIGRYFEHCNIIKFGQDIESHIMGLMLVDGLKLVLVSQVVDHLQNKELLLAVDMIQDGLESNTDFSDIQENMIDAGLREYAKF